MGALKKRKMSLMALGVIPLIAAAISVMISIFGYMRFEEEAKDLGEGLSEQVEILSSFEEYIKGLETQLLGAQLIVQGNYLLGKELVISGHHACSLFRRLDGLQSHSNHELAALLQLEDDVRIVVDTVAANGRKIFETNLDDAESAHLIKQVKQYQGRLSYFVQVLELRNTLVIAALNDAIVSTRVELNHIQKHLGNIVFVGNGLALLLLLIVFMAFVEKLRKAFSEFLDLTEAIAAGDFEQRVGQQTTEEFHNLGIAFNHMLKSLNESAARQRSYIDALESAKEQAEEGSRAKSDFLSLVSHELRTPMNGILGMAHILETTKPSPEQTKSLILLKKSGRRLLAVVDEMIDYTELLSTQTTGKGLQVFSLKTLIEQIHEGFKFHEKTAVTHYLQWDDSIPPLLIGVPEQLRRLLLHLYSNAWHHTNTGNITLRVDLRELTENETTLSLEVSDTGSGIPNEKLEHIFEPFAQVHSGMARQHQGVGLGLTLVRRLVTLLKGEILVKSEVGVGSQFKVTIPFGRADTVSDPSKVADQVAEVQEPINVESFVLRDDEEELRYNFRVMLLADDESERATLVLLLEGQGCHVEAFEWSEDVMDTLNNFDLVVGCLPKKMDDVSQVFWDKVKSDDTGLATSFVIVSDPNQVSAEQYKSNIHGVEWIERPLLPVNITDALQSIYELSNSKQSSDEAVAASNGRPTALLVDDNSVNLMILGAIVEKANWNTVKKSNGQEALQWLEQNEDVRVVLTDLQMPMMDGWTLAKRVRILENKNADIPIIAISSNSSEADRQHCRNAGMDDFIPKPVKPEMVKQFIQRYEGSGESVERISSRLTSK